MKPVGVKFDTNVDFFVESNIKKLKFKVRDHVQMSKYENIFSKN